MIFGVVWPLVSMVLMVKDHWSNDGMGSMDRSSLLCEFLIQQESQVQWIEASIERIDFIQSLWQRKDCW